jgi:hypothetical protein
MVQRLGKNAELGKMDLKSAFRLFPVYPGNYDLFSLSIFNRAPSGFESTDFKFFESKGCLGPL